MIHAARLLGLAAAAFALSGAAPEPPPVEGLYVAHIMETASALEIQPGGRFRWMLSVGALDLESDGLWSRREDGSLLLNTDPPVVPPRVELVSTGRDRHGGVLVRIPDGRGETPYFLDAEAEYADGTRRIADFQQGEHRFPKERNRRIVAVRVVSSIFGIASDRYPVSPETGNVLTFRFIPNQLGRVDFRDLLVRVEPKALSFAWSGTDLRYEREEPDQEMPAGDDGSEGPGCIDADAPVAAPSSC